MARYLAIIALFFSLLGVSCKENEDFPRKDIAEYAPFRIGQFWLYKLDSTVYINFGTKGVVRSYLARDVVEDSLVDLSGRKSYRIIRYLNDTLQSGLWTPIIAFMATQTDGSFEWVENNRRFIKIAAPVRENFTWKAHRYIDLASSSVDDQYLNDWDYQLQRVGQPYASRLNNLTFSNTITIQQRDESSPEGIGDAQDVNYSIDDPNFSFRTYAKEIYAKDIGLVYKEFIRWEYQNTAAPGESPSGKGRKNGFGIKLQLLQHN